MNQLTTNSNPNNQTVLTKITSWFLLTITALLPILVIPLTPNFLADSKLYLIIAAALITSLIYFFQSFKKNSCKLILSPVTLPLFLFIFSALASTLFTQNYPVENLLGIGSIYLGSAFIALLGPNLIDKHSSQLFNKVFGLSAAVLTATTLLQIIGWGPTRLISSILGITIQDKAFFSLAGSNFVSLQIIAIALVGQTIEVIKSKKLEIFHIFIIPILIFGLSLSVWTTFIKNNDFLVNPISSSWSAALDSLRTPKSTLIGQGPAGYSNNFNQYKPNWINGTDFWQATFNAGFNFPLTVVVQLGLFGLTAWILLALKFTNTAKKAGLNSSPLTWMVMTTFLIQLLAPPNYVLIGLQGLLIAFWVAQFKDEFSSLNLSPLSINLDQNSSHELNEEGTKIEGVVSLLINGTLTVGTLTLFYLAGRAYASSYHMLEAQKGLLANDGIKVYNQQRQAVNLNPLLDINRRKYAQTNLQIAHALSQKTDNTEEEAQQISQLVQQAVREARAATTIDPEDPANWSTLAQVYEQLVGSVEESDQWAVDAYVEAIQNAPNNPLLRISLGNLLLQQEKINQAANLFSQATQLKPNLAAPYFHLGRAQQQNQQLAAAKQSWQQALQLLEKDSEEYQLVEQNLTQLNKMIEQASAAGQMQTGQAQQQTPTTTEPGSKLQQKTQLGQELPSITDQNVQQTNDDTVTDPESQPLDLSQESQKVINQKTTPEITPEAPEDESQPEAPEEDESQPETNEPAAEEEEEEEEEENSDQQ